MTEIRQLQEIELSDQTLVRVTKAEAFISLDVTGPPNPQFGPVVWQIRMTHEETQALIEMLTVKPPTDALTAALHLAKQVIPTLPQPEWTDIFTFKQGSWRCNAHGKTPKTCRTCRGSAGFGTHTNPTDKDEYCNLHSRRVDSCANCQHELSQHSNSQPAVGEISDADV